MKCRLKVVFGVESSFLNYQNYTNIKQFKRKQSNCKKNKLYEKSQKDTNDETLATNIALFQRYTTVFSVAV